MTYKLYWRTRVTGVACAVHSLRISIGTAVRRHGFVAPFFLLIALLFTYPTLLHLHDAIGGQQDALENYWNLWWTFEAVRHGWNPFFGAFAQYPFGLPLYFHTYNSLNAFLSLPIQACCGTAVAFNVLNWFAFVMAGIGSYALVWHLTQRRPAALIAGLIYAFSPYMAFHFDVGQPFMLSLEWLPFYILALLKGLRQRSIWLPVASVVLLFVGLTDLHYLAYSVTATALIGIYEALALGAWRPILRLIGKLALVVGLFALLFSPVLVPTLLTFMHEPYAQRPIEHSIVHTTDLLAFFLPSIFHPLWGGWASAIFRRLNRSFVVGGIATLGYIPLTLAIYGASRDWRRSKLFVLLFVVFALLALGPYLQINGVNSLTTDHPIPMPYLLFRQLPFMSIQRIPSRFVSMVMLTLAVVAGVGVAWLWDRPWVIRGGVRRQALLLGLLMAALLFEYWPKPFRITPIGPDQVPLFYRQLGSDPANYAILEVPYLWKPSMFYQTYHQKPLVGGRIARPRQHPWENARIFGPLLQVRAPWPDIGADDSPEATRAALACQNVRYVVFYRQNLDPKQRAGAQALEQELFRGVRPAYEDKTLRAYGPLTDTSREAYWTPADDWYEAETSTTEPTSRWIKGNQGTLLVYPCGTTEVTLHFQVTSYATPRTLRVNVNGQLVSETHVKPNLWADVTLPITLHQGENRIELQSADPASGGAPNDPRLLNLRVAAISLRSGLN